MREVADTPPVAVSAPRRAGGFDTLDLWLSHRPGERLDGRYQLIRKLNRGGMGVVWIAHHLALDVHVALKLVSPDAESPEAAERLIREAQAAARLDHPAIVDIIDVGRTAEGAPFLVMELLEGESLGDVLNREQRLDVETAIRLLLPIADALQAMHDKGLVHRDIKPENIFLAQSDAGRWQPKLIDFGLVRVDTRLDRRLTQEGVVLGTPAYLSPERIRGEEAYPTDDVWALCVALYEVLSGERPFSDENPMRLLVEASEGNPRTLAEHGVSAPEVWAILQRGFQRREERWESVRELGTALANELRRRGVTDDITGVALTARWPEIAASHPIAPRAPQPANRPPERLRTSDRARSVDVPVTLASRPPEASLPPPALVVNAPESEPGPRAPPAASRRPWILAAIAMALAGLAALLMHADRGPRSADAAPAQPTLTPTSTATAEPQATALATANPAPAPATATPLATATAHAPPPRRAPSPPPPPKNDLGDLKDPYAHGP